MNRGEKTIRKAMEIGMKNSNLMFYHVNLLYEDSKISSAEMRREVEKLFPELKGLRRVSYDVEDSYLLDESLAQKISNSKADAVIMGKSMVPRWRKFLKFLKNRSITEEIEQVAQCKVIVVE